MIRHLQHEDIDRSAWDALIDKSPNGLVYARSWYLDVVSPRWEALVEDDYKAVFPLTCRRKFGISYLFQPFFTQQLGVFSAGEFSASKVEQFLSAIPPHFRLVEIQLNHSNKISRSDYVVKDRLTHHLHLGSSYDDIRKNYSENLKRNLKRAQQSGFMTTSDFKTGTLITLFRQNRGRGVETLKEKDYAVFEKLVEAASSRGLITKTGTIVNGELQAGAVFIRSNHEYIFLFSATDDKAKETGAMSFIIDDFIRSHAGENMQLDFEGSMDAGLARYYKSFGSDEIVYLQIRKNNLPLPLRWLK